MRLLVDWWLRRRRRVRRRRALAELAWLGARGRADAGLRWDDAWQRLHGKD